MPFSPLVTHESEVLDEKKRLLFPGVKFVVQRMGFSRRTDLDFATLKLRQRLRELEAEHPPQSDREKELSQQLAAANRKALLVPADQFAEVMEKEVAPIAKELAVSIPPEVKKRRTVLNEEYVQIENRIKEHWIRAGLVAILHRGAEESDEDWRNRKITSAAGGDLDGMTAEQLLEYGPPDLAKEIYDAMESDGRLSGTETKNLPLPITSGVAVDGEKTNTTAPNAGDQPADGTKAVTASGTSPQT